MFGEKLNDFKRLKGSKKTILSTLLEFGIPNGTTAMA
jgi:hypothetical protein